MDNRSKPEELEQEIQESIQDISEDTPIEEEKDVEVGSEDVETDDAGEVEEVEEVEEEIEQPTAKSEKAEKTEKVEKVEKPVEPDYREKFKASAQEAQVLASKNSKFIDSVDQAAQLSEVSEDELKQEYPDWDELSASQKKIARDNLLNKRRFDIVHSAVLETKKHDEWAGKVDAFLEDDAQIANYTGLAGREQEFKNFCMKPTRVGVDLGDLVSAFLYTVPAPSGRHKGSLLQTGSNATGVDTKPKKMNEEDAEALRAKNPKAYLDAIKSGKIDIDI